MPHATLRVLLGLPFSPIGCDYHVQSESFWPCACAKVSPQRTREDGIDLSTAAGCARHLLSPPALNTSQLRSRLGSSIRVSVKSRNLRQRGASSDALGTSSIPGEQPSGNMLLCRAPQTKCSAFEHVALMHEKMTRRFANSIAPRSTYSAPIHTAAPIADAPSPLGRIVQVL